MNFSCCLNLFYVCVAVGVVIEVCEVELYFKLITSCFCKMCVYLEVKSKFYF